MQTQEFGLKFPLYIITMIFDKSTTKKDRLVLPLFCTIEDEKYIILYINRKNAESALTLHNSKNNTKASSNNQKYSMSIIKDIESFNIIIESCLHLKLTGFIDQENQRLIKFKDIQNIFK